MALVLSCSITSGFEIRRMASKEYFKCNRLGGACRLQDGACVCQGISYARLRSKCHASGWNCWMSGMKCTCHLGMFRKTCFTKGKKCENRKGRCFCVRRKVKSKCSVGCINLGDSCLCKRGTSPGCSIYGEDCYEKRGRCFCSRELKIVSGINRCAKYGKECYEHKGACRCPIKPSKPVVPMPSPSAKSTTTF